jgi:hypothetical protein
MNLFFAIRRIGFKPLLLLLAGLLWAGGAAGGPSDGTNSALDAKAKALIAGKSSRAEKIVAVHAFVRDAIKQVETRYG